MQGQFRAETPVKLIVNPREEGGDELGGVDLYRLELLGHGDKVNAANWMIIQALQAVKRSASTGLALCYKS